MKTRSKRISSFTHKKSLSKKASHRHNLVPLNSSASFLEEKTKHLQHLQHLQSLQSLWYIFVAARHETHIFKNVFSLTPMPFRSRIVILPCSVLQT